MELFQQRVVEEKASLDEKIALLVNFITSGVVFPALPFEERSRLKRQRFHMEQYSAVLGERIGAFK